MAFFLRQTAISTQKRVTTPLLARKVKRDTKRVFCNENEISFHLFFSFPFFFIFSYQGFQDHVWLLVFISALSFHFTFVVIDSVIENNEST